MKVLLIGGTGVLSTDIAKQSIEMEFDLFMINRGNNRGQISPKVNLIIGDINNLQDIKRKIHDYYFDVVIDFLSYTPEQLNNTLEVFKKKCNQYIFISSATVYSTSNPDEYITEETPLSNVDWEYSKNKILCENLLKEKAKTENFQYTIIRPYITYGKTRVPYALISKKRQWTLVDRIINEKPIVLWDDGKAVCTLTNTKDFAVAVVGLFGKKEAYNQSFHITSNELLTWKDVLYKIAEAVGKEPKIIYIPSKFIEDEMPEMKGELTEDKSISRKFDNTKIKNVVSGFNCTIDFREGISETIEYYKSRPSMKKIDYGWNSQIELLILNYFKTGKVNDLNINMSEYIPKSKFRRGLFYHLNTFKIKMYKLIQFAKKSIRVIKRKVNRNKTH